MATTNPVTWVLPIATEFFGSLLFAFFGGLAPAPYGAFANGLALAVLIYCCASVSGGHLNPAVSLSIMITGHLPWIQGVLYIVAQIAGMIGGAALTRALKPDSLVDPGCFFINGISHVQLWAWELIMTLLLVSTVHSVAVSMKGHGESNRCSSHGPLFVPIANGVC